MPSSSSWVVSSIFRTIRNHLVVVPPDAACSNMFSDPNPIAQCASTAHKRASMWTNPPGRAPTLFVLRLITQLVQSTNFLLCLLLDKVDR